MDIQSELGWLARLPGAGSGEGGQLARRLRQIESDLARATRLERMSQMSRARAAAEVRRLVERAPRFFTQAEINAAKAHRPSSGAVIAQDGDGIG